VKTSGRFAGARSGGEGRSWLLIKHRDDWSGELDIAEFAPRSVKSDGDFEDILGGDAPAIWTSHRPAKGGEAGEMLAKIIERAAALKAGTKAGGSGKTERTKREGRTKEQGRIKTKGRTKNQRRPKA
jgi:hypothetical protein